MYNPFFSQPVVVDVQQERHLRLRLPEDASDFIVLQMLNAPLVEMIVIDNSVGKSRLTIKSQAFLRLEFEPESATGTETGSRELPSGHSLVRGMGQGLRLYPRLGTAPGICAAQLRTGICLTLTPGATSLSFSQAGDSLFESVPLEHDLRLFQEPKDIMLAKALLARNYDYSESSQMLAVHIAELEQVRSDLQAFLRGELGKLHPGLSAEATQLDSQLLKKRQWLFRTYSQQLERQSYGQAANESLSQEKLQRKLDCYELLAPSGVTEMVRRLTDDEHDIVL
ncbi:hypothetical protein LZP73_14960 [Shewanella sp. AS16]|uniref:hypothetical protein n=1 Tax=Shewanella sp. AS16 TaxID=2907625 RepID=UPI001F264B08|nr:hypothetical protein [Shewanella sp. AS16]MCE9687487.1 hypothetical protein [Shewanella sp. AS16]